MVPAIGRSCRDGFHTPSGSPLDRRRLVFAAITPAGRDVVEGTSVVLASVAHAHIASRPTAAELATLSATLRAIADAPSWQEQITTTVGCAVASALSLK